MNFESIKRISSSLSPERAILLLGPPGAGKTALAQQMGLGGEVAIIDLNAHLPEDLAGYPQPVNGHVRRVPEKWMYDLSEEVIGEGKGVLVLDDLSQTGPSMQAAVFRIALERRAGGKQLGKNVRVVVTANRRSDKAGAGAILSPLVSRCWTSTLDPSMEEWVKWAIEQNLDSRVIGYLQFRPNHFIKLPSEADSEGRFPCPRTWEFLARSLKGTKQEDIYDLASGFIGDGVGVEFAAFCKHYESLPNISEALENPEKVQRDLDRSETDRIIAVLTAITDYAGKNKVPAEKLVHALDVLSRGNEHFAHSIKIARKYYSMIDLAKSLQSSAPSRVASLATALQLGE